MWLAAESVGPAAAAGASQSATKDEVAILQIRVLEGEGAVVTAGTRSARGIIAQITDETGRPVEGVAVSFRLPAEGPSGAFASGLKTEIAVTGPDGRAAVYGIQWNSATGPIQIRVTAVKGEARAGTMIAHYSTESAQLTTSGTRRGAPERSSRAPKGSGRKWLLLGLIAAGAGGGAVAGLSRGKSGGATPLPPAASTAAPTVGTPAISIGRP